MRGPHPAPLGLLRTGTVARPAGSRTPLDCARSAAGCYRCASRRSRRRDHASVPASWPGDSPGDSGSSWVRRDLPDAPQRRQTIGQAAARLASRRGGGGGRGEDLPSVRRPALRSAGRSPRYCQRTRSGPDRPGPRLVPVPLPSPADADLAADVPERRGGAAAIASPETPTAVPTGWPPDLRDLPGEATATSTAFGIRTMLLLEDGLAADLVPVAESLRKMAFAAGGYAGREQSGPRPRSNRGGAERPAPDRCHRGLRRSHRPDGAGSG